MNNFPVNSSPQIIMVTATNMPKADLDSELLISALADLGISSQILPWDHQNIDWSKIPLVLLRTPWDYFHRPQEFLNWAEKINKLSKLINPLELIKWNFHKSYLPDLERHGIKIVPTILINQKDAKNAAQIFDNSEFEEMVIKPAISGGAIGAERGKKSDQKLFSHLNDLLKNHDVLIQPFIKNIIDNGEVSLVYFDGKFSHAIIKKVAKGEYRVQQEYGGSVQIYHPTPQELQTADLVLSAVVSKLNSMPTYARVDLVTYQTNPVLMELEIIEPELFLRTSPSGIKNFAQILKSFL